uniref:Protein kinase domain-containing protein n=1 Tax=Trepomonas sp. PC1 TaxID=1076344 RepID=A0A146KGG3_9EUKA|eukprot:JAP95860.1 Protein kinase domain-containing protein [Trepomonas sp. PC1]
MTKIIINQFEFDLYTDRIGDGQFATVFKAKNNDQLIDVALKVFKNENTLSNLSEQAKIEYQILQIVKDRYVSGAIEILQDYEVENKQFQQIFGDKVQIIVTEFCEGLSLENYMLNKAKKNQIIAFKLMLQLARAVETLHLKNYIHLDIKPANILLTKYNDIVLCDFGISQQVESARGYVYCENGTLNFMAPEIMKSPIKEQRITTASDIWSMGVVWYYILFNKLPYNLGPGDVDYEKIHMLENVQIDYCHEFQNDEKFKSLIYLTQKMMNQNPACRPTAAEVVQTFTKINDLNIQNLIFNAYKSQQVQLNNQGIINIVASAGVFLYAQKDNQIYVLLQNYFDIPKQCMKGFADFGGRMAVGDVSPIVCIIRNLAVKTRNRIVFLDLQASTSVYIEQSKYMLFFHQIEKCDSLEFNHKRLQVKWFKLSEIFQTGFEYKLNPRLMLAQNEVELFFSAKMGEIK